MIIFNYSLYPTQALPSTGQNGYYTFPLLTIMFSPEIKPTNQGSPRWRQRLHCDTFLFPLRNSKCAYWLPLFHGWLELRGSKQHQLLILGLYSPGLDKQAGFGWHLKTARFGLMGQYCLQQGTNLTHFTQQTYMKFEHNLWLDNTANSQLTDHTLL